MRWSVRLLLIFACGRASAFLRPFGTTRNCVSNVKAAEINGEPPVKLLRQIEGLEKWACISSCGACCYLSLESRPDVPKYMSAVELNQYEAMIGPDGWCVNFDQGTRLCKIYETRPELCKVEKGIKNIAKEDVSSFARDSCRSHISDVYGVRSIELSRFEQVLDSIDESRDV
jgi:hypothetical protein